MCKFKLFSIAAAALMMVACSSEDTALNNNRAAGPQMQFTATIAAPSGTTRTTYEQDGDNINVKWVEGDEIALVHNKVKDVATVKTINSDGSATITGYVTGATNEADVQLYYPAARISGVTSDGNPVFDGSVEGKISSQDGTPKYIQDNLDFRVGISTFSVNGSEATLKEAAKMLSQIAIWKLKLKDNASALLEASKVSIEMGSGDYTTSATATLSSPNSELTIATKIPRAIDNVRPITIEATVGNNTYVYKQDNVDVTPGKYYQSTVAFGKPVATVTTAPTASSETIYPQSTKALVNAGVAKNGTMMYRLTTSNTKPETAGDFSEDVPTAAGILNAGTYYVWYYAKGDDTHADSEIAGPVEITVAKPAATVATPPTATASVTAGSTTALVTAGVADGGTMMYAVTTTNTKPTSTTGFSATIPTSEGIVTEGTYYVWYYVKADGSHTDSAISASAVSVTVTVVLANGITLSKTETIINYWSTTPTETLTATVTPDKASNKTVVWSSDNKAVATVDETTGEITSVAPGTANITARTTDGTDLTATCAVTVYNNYLKTPGRGATVYMTFGENAPTHSGTIYFTGKVTTSSDSNSIAYRHYTHGSYDRLSFNGVQFYNGSSVGLPSALYISGGTGTETDPYVLSTP